MKDFFTKHFIAASIAVALLIGFVGLAVTLVFVSPHKTLPPPVQNESPMHTVIGKSVQGRNIDAYTYLPLGRATTTDDKKMLFVGGIHGGYEWNSVVLAYTFKDYLDAHPEFVPRGVSITIIPDANPDAVFKVVGKEGEFSAADVPAGGDLSFERFNADKVDLNRNFDCKWQPTGTWRSQKVNAGTAAFSEPETRAVRDFVLRNHIDAAVFWHSQSDGVYASQCEHGILPETLLLMEAYATASGYPAYKTFDAYTTTGAADDWLASENIPALTVELKTHQSVEWPENFAGIKSILSILSR